MLSLFKSCSSVRICHNARALRFYGAKTKTKSQHEEKEKQRQMAKFADMRGHHLLYPEARAMQRKFVLHIGPTNSGKTHSAVQHLVQAKSGYFCAPLRLLAAEVWDKLNKDYKIPCDLITGQQVLEVPGAQHSACTIEMVNLGKPVDVALIDEYQLLSSPDRGWAWTRAIMGLRAKEVHLTGDASQVAMITHLVQVMGDELEIRNYERLSPLNPTESIDSYANVRPGDAIIAFSRDDVYRIKSVIEQITRRKCCVVYGSLPPDARKNQADLFNDTTGRDHRILVGTDAIGLGLNLNIGRVIFSTLKKFDGVSERYLTPGEIRQIGGRAGRFKSAYPNGEVTTLLAKEAKFLRAAMDPNLKLEPTPQIVVFPDFQQISKFSQIVGPMKFSKLLRSFERFSCFDKHFVLSDYRTMFRLSLEIDDLPFNLQDRHTFCLAPADTNKPLLLRFFRSFASSFSATGTVPFGLGMLPSITGEDAKRLLQLELNYKIVELYIWLSHRFDAFVDWESAEEVLDGIENDIDQTLDKLKLPHFKHQKRGVRKGTRKKKRH